MLYIIHRFRWHNTVIITMITVRCNVDINCQLSKLYNITLRNTHTDETVSDFID